MQVHFIDNVSLSQCWKRQLRYINHSNTYLIYLHNSVCIIYYCIWLLAKVFLQVKKLPVTLNTGTLSLKFCVNHPGNVLKTTLYYKLYINYYIYINLYKIIIYVLLFFFSITLVMYIIQNVYLILLLLLLK